MKIINAKVYNEEFQFQNQDLWIRDGLIAEQNPADTEVLDADGLYAIPGLIDIHLHGCMGHDFCDGTDEALEAICRYEGRQGVTAIAPASMTLAEDTLMTIFQNAAKYSGTDGAIFCGINMEGPFFSAAKKGAQNGAYLKEPDVELYRKLQQAAGGKIKLVDIAPELEGAIPFISAVADKVRVSIAHTTADYDTAMQAFHSGASHVTHLYNAMPPFTHRAPGVIGAARDAGAVAEVICDGIHIHASVIRATVEMYGVDKLVLISDSMMATGLDDGDYSLGGQAVKVVGNYATLADGTLAGSVTNLFDCMRKAVSFGIPLESAVRMATINPAREIGEENRMGSLSVGKLANVVLMDRDLKIHKIYIQGQELR